MTIRALTVGAAVALVAGAGSVLPAQPAARPGAPVVRYDGHRIVRVVVRGEADLAAMERLGARLWACEPQRGPVEFGVPPESMAALDASGIPYTIVVSDLQKQVDNENARLGPQGGGGGVAGAGWFDDYKTLTQIQAYCAGLAAQFPNLVEPVTIGNSLEGRPIFGLRIRGDAGGRCVPTLLMNSCQHAREWITPMVTVYFADRLLRAYGTDPDLTALVDSTEIIIIPVVNADGYEYTWSVDRFWRKNRRNNGDGTFGVDLNRNWGYQWGVTLPGGNGGNGNTGSDVYWGTGPFSEPETAALSQFSESLPALRWHNDIHSAAQLVLQPWGWTGDLPPDHAFLDGVGADSQSLIKAVHNATYVHGTCYSKLYPLSGGAQDWFYGQNGVPSFLYELRGPGFDPPPSAILLGAEEMFPALVSHASYIADTFPFKADWDQNCVYDLFDFLAFVNDFNAGESRADVNGDGALDLFDFLEFVNLFNAGK